MNNPNELPDPQEVKAFLQGKPVSAAFHTQLSTHVEALLKGLEASTKDLTRPGADPQPFFPKKPRNES